MDTPLTLQMWEAVAEARTVFQREVVAREGGLLVLEVAVPAAGTYLVRVEIEKQHRLVTPNQEGAVT
jgi:hypothetical protein